MYKFRDFSQKLDVWNGCISQKVCTGNLSTRLTRQRFIVAKIRVELNTRRVREINRKLGVGHACPHFELITRVDKFKGNKDFINPLFRNGRVNISRNLNYRIYIYFSEMFPEISYSLRR